ncbi:venom metalloproteinase antarease-like TtrivMP_A [Centruroides sculpturatus]|uniref:venom metalloproteinase antarease-like TtrivMP_A n=1 Tax=Centruroides sculpturatus TaxID=218467 RepID=UPI000C6E0609|nr:venom metalloproteinase antarease-like TtrivMP_A [Centruroides sculpturatus]
MFSLLTIFIFSTVVLASPIDNPDRVDVFYPTLKTLKSGEKRITFRVDEQDVDIILEPADQLIADNFTITHLNDENKHYSADVGNFKQKLFRNKEKGAAFHIDEDGPLTINGIINSKFKIMPYESNELIKDGKKAHRITKLLSKKRQFNDVVIPPNIKKMYTDQKMKKLSYNQCIVIEYLLVTESNFTSRFSNIEDMKVHLSLMFVGAQNLIDTLHFGIKLRLIALMPFTKRNEPSFIEKSAIPGAKHLLDSGKLLDTMSNYYCKLENDPIVKQADIIMLIIRRKLGDINSNGIISDGTVGIANLGGACDPCSKCGIMEDDDSYVDRDDTFAHESAHL